MGKDGKEIIQGSPVECMAVINGDMVINNKGTASIISSKTGTTVSVVDPNGIKSKLFTPSACISSPPTLKTPPPSSVSDLVTIMRSISQDSAATKEVNTMILGPMKYFKELQMKLSMVEENSARFLNRLNFIAEKINETCVTPTLDTYGEEIATQPNIESDWWGGKRTRSKRHSKRSSMKKRK